MNRLAGNTLDAQVIAALGRALVERGELLKAATLTPPTTRPYLRSRKTTKTNAPAASSWARRINRAG